MRILVVGDWHSELHEEPLYMSLLSQGHDAIRFQWHHYFLPHAPLRFIKSIALRIQNKYRLGPVVDKINRDLCHFIKENNPEVIFLYRASHIYPETLEKIRLINKRIILIGYNNDDPFSPLYSWWVWRHFKGSIRLLDLVLSYRVLNIDEYYSNGAKSVKLFRSWYLPAINKPVHLSISDKNLYSCDVTFIGHFENDGRADYLEEILVNDINLKIFGPEYGWDSAINNYKLLQNKIPVKRVLGKEYNKALCGSKIALCFLSKLNRDTYTRRCFEIPASGTMMLAEYSDDLASLFKEGKEIEFFRDKDEMISKIKFYLANNEERRRISDAGLQRVKRDGHDIDSRVKDLVLSIHSIIEKL
jgi:spore maturation protein CgeB